MKSCTRIRSSQHRGRKRQTCTETDSLIIKKTKDNRFISAPKIANAIHTETGNKVHPKTVKRRLSEYGITARSPRKVPLISQVNRQRRVELCKQWILKGPSFWKRVIWSDETKLNYFKSDGKHYCWRLAGEEYNPECTQKTVKYGGGCTMLWGCMAASGVGNLVKIDGTMNAVGYLRILQENLVDSAIKLGLETDFVFQQDNDPKHTSRLLKTYFEENDIHVLPWAPQSPDIAVIEHLWSYAKDKYHESLSTSRHGVLGRIQEIWNSIQPNVTLQLVKSVYRRFEAVIKAKGGATRY